MQIYIYELGLYCCIHCQARPTGVWESCVISPVGSVMIAVLAVTQLSQRQIQLWNEQSAAFVDLRSGPWSSFTFLFLSLTLERCDHFIHLP